MVLNETIEFVFEGQVYQGKIVCLDYDYYDVTIKFADGKYKIFSMDEIKVKQ